MFNSKRYVIKTKKIKKKFKMMSLHRVLPLTNLPRSEKRKINIVRLFRNYEKYNSEIEKHNINT